MIINGIPLQSRFESRRQSRGLHREPRGQKGQLIFLTRRHALPVPWDRVNSALENDEIIKGYIKCRTKGGMIVDVFGIESILARFSNRR